MYVVGGVSGGCLAIISFNSFSLIKMVEIFTPDLACIGHFRHSLYRTFSGSKYKLGEILMLWLFLKRLKIF